MEQQSKFGDKIKDFIFNNKVPLLFLVICLFAFWASGMTTVLFFNELSVRIGRETFMVLALLIPVVAGLGLNFGIVIVAMSAQIGMFIVILFEGVAAPGLFTIALIATPIAVLLGFLVGKLFNNMKGSEMIGGMVLALFANGIYQFIFLFLLGGIIPVDNARLMTPSGVGVINVIDIGAGPNYMRQALDNIAMLHMITVGFWAMLALFIILIIIRLVKKEKVSLKGQRSIRKPMIALIILAIFYLGSGLGGVIFVNDLTLFLYADRLRALYAIWYGTAILAAYVLYVIIMHKVVEKKPGIPTRPILFLVIAVLAVVATFIEPIYNGLTGVGIPVFSYGLIIVFCFGITWLMRTRLGQNMRSVGQSRPIATAAGINVNRTRIIAMILSTVLGAYAQIMLLQNFGVMNTYNAHETVGIFAIAALLVGGASVTKASVKHAITGVILFHSLFILSPVAGTNLMGNAVIGEYFRLFIAYAVIALALVMHAWQRVKKKRAASEEVEDEGSDSEKGLEAEAS